MTYNGIHPIVEVIRDTYHKGVKLTKRAMNKLEKRFKRMLGLEKWFIRIIPKLKLG
jgi:hypothetical protein